jgi:hypothetical protein
VFLKKPHESLAEMVENIILSNFEMITEHFNNYQIFTLEIRIYKRSIHKLSEIAYLGRETGYFRM